MHTRKVGCLELTTFLGALCFVRVVDPDPEDTGPFDDDEEQLVAPPEPSWYQELIAGIRSFIPRFMWRLP